MLEAILLASALIDDSNMLATGKIIRPIGKHISVGSYPSNLIASPDGKRVVVSTIGYRQWLSVIDTGSGEVISKTPYNGNTPNLGKEGLYFGLALDATGTTLYASRGAQDLIDRLAIGADGTMTKSGEPLVNPGPNRPTVPYHPAGIALTSDGSKLIVANNQTSHLSDYKGSVSVIDTASGKQTMNVAVSGFPYALALKTVGPMANRKAYVASERDGRLDVVDVELGAVLKSIPTGASPEALLFDPSQARLFVANYGSDTISVVDTAADRVIETVMLRPSDLRGIPGAGPQGMALSPDGSRLYVALSDMNAVAVVDGRDYELEGYIPTAWLPTAIVAIGSDLFVACAKGAQAKNPNNKPVGANGQYIQNIIDGCVTKLPAPTKEELAKLTEQVIQNNRLRGGIAGKTHPDFYDPGIEYVIYVIKENRTYDNVLADIPKGNGDKSICLFPRHITPNQHALAERFVLLDNFHVCAEVSQDGWVWSTAGMVNAYASRNTPYNYSGRGRTYDTEGSNNGVPVDLMDLPDVTRPPSGYIWEHCHKYKVSYRNYGFFTQFADALDKRNTALKDQIENMPSKKLLQGMTDENFRRYDLQYADSEIYDKYGWNWPKQRKTYGAFNMISRFSEWKREFDGFAKKGVMPKFQMIRFGQDHTSGTQDGQPTASSMVADNDYAVGQLVETISKSRFWKKTLICILEDDAQNGYDHVDAHRSTAYVISPFIKRGTHDSRFYNTDSMLRTMTLALGMPPMSMYDAVASPIAVFGKEDTNSEPYTAIMPARNIVCQANTRTAYRSQDSEKISNYIEEGDIDEDLNDILWGSIFVDRPRPTVKRQLGRFADPDDDGKRSSK